MKRFATLLVVTLISAACNPTATAAPVLVSPVSSNTPIVGISTDVPQAGIPIVPVTAISVPETVGSLWLQVLSPLDEAVVNIPQVDVIGSAPAGTVLSINDEILIAGNDGQFKVTVMLEDGPNLVEITASDENGNETTVLLMVTYEP